MQSDKWLQIFFFNLTRKRHEQEIKIKTNQKKKKTEANKYLPKITTKGLYQLFCLVSKTSIFPTPAEEAELMGVG